MKRPFSSGWCPFNETWDHEGRKQFDALLSTVYKATKAVDPTRPCIDTSGNFHTITDIYDLHDYTQEPEVFARHYAELGKSNRFDFSSAFSDRQTYDGKCPFFVSEYGGAYWSNDSSGWGYGDTPKTPEEFLDRLERLTDVLLQNNFMFGLCYTQLTDIEQEQNGLYAYDRIPKFPPEKIKAFFQRKPLLKNKIQRDCLIESGSPFAFIYDTFAFSCVTPCAVSSIFSARMP